MASEPSSAAGDGRAEDSSAEGVSAGGLGVVGSGATGAPGAPVPPVPSVKDIDVAPEKVAEVARIIGEQAEKLDEQLSEHLGSLEITAPAEDTVSTHAIGAWNDVVTGPEDSYAAQARAYVTELRRLASQLHAAGEEYTRSDQDKADTFGGRGTPA